MGSCSWSKTKNQSHLLICIVYHQPSACPSADFRNSLFGTDKQLVREFEVSWSERWWIFLYNKILFVWSVKRSQSETLRRGSGMQVPVGFPGFVMETSFGAGLVSERTLSNQSTKMPTYIIWKGMRSTNISAFTASSMVGKRKDTSVLLPQAWWDKYKQCTIRFYPLLREPNRNQSNKATRIHSINKYMNTNNFSRGKPSLIREVKTTKPLNHLKTPLIQSMGYTILSK